jgi:FkbM family methyltransferase
MLKQLLELCLRFRFVRVLIERLKVRTIANAFLRRFPRYRQLGGIRTRMCSIDSVLVDREIFEEGEYRGMFPLGNVQSFADLGCNCGFFTCFLADSLDRKDIAGLLIDGNPTMVSEARWHVQTNQLANVSAEWGMVGAGSTEKSQNFYLHPDAAGSSRFPTSPEGRVTRDQWQKIEVPVLSLAAEWRKRFGERRCDLVKIDIEGSEQTFLTDEADFIRRTKVVLVEIHRWLVDEAAIERQLFELGFRLANVLSTSPEADVRMYVRA